MGIPVQVFSRLMGHANVPITMRYVDVGVGPLAQFLVPAAGEEDELERQPLR